MGDVQVDSRTVAPRLVRVASMLTYVVALTWWVRVMGIPKQALPAFAWIWLATIAWNILAPWRAHLDFLRDWSIPLAVLTVYLYSRGIADDLGFVSVHVTAPIEVDRRLFGGTLPTEYLQAKLCGNPCDRTSPRHWYDVVLTTVYYSHFVVALTIAAVLWLRDRSAWVWFMRRYLALNILALVVYITYPMAPPWLARAGRFRLRPCRADHRPRLVRPEGGGLPPEAVRGREPGGRDAVAARGRLLVRCACTALSRLRSRWRWLLLLYPLTMAFTLVYYAEHYVIDILAGWAARRPRAVGVRRVGTRPRFRPSRVTSDDPDPEPAQSVTGRRLPPPVIAGQKARIVPLQTGVRHGTTLAAGVRRRSHRSATRTEARGGAGTSGGTRPRAVAASRWRRRRKRAVRRPTCRFAGLEGWLPALATHVAVRGFGLLVLVAVGHARSESAYRSLTRWDADWYRRIAEHGYGSSHVVADGRTLDDYAFFPLYPALERLLAEVSGLRIMDAGLVISAVASMVAAVGIFKVGAHVYDERVGLILVADLVSTTHLHRAVHGLFRVAVHGAGLLVPPGNREAQVCRRRRPRVPRRTHPSVGRCCRRRSHRLGRPPHQGDRSATFPADLTRS